MKNKHIIVIIHGIKTPTKSKWQKEWADTLMKTDNHLDVRVYKYGYIFGFISWLMTVSRWLRIPSFLRKKYIGGFEKYLTNLQRDNPGAEISIIAHSFGTWITYFALNRIKVKNYAIKIRNIIFISGVISSHIEKTELANWLGTNWIKSINSWSSHNDDVVGKIAVPPFGKLGYRGFVRYGHDGDYRKPAKKPYDLQLFNNHTEEKHSGVIFKIEYYLKLIYKQIIV